MNEQERARVAEIEALFAGITPGEWAPDLIENVVYTTIDGENYTVCVAESGAEWRNGANFANDLWFIAFAPEHIRELLELVRRLDEALNADGDK